ncbi:MAG: hypothetical protein K6F05_04350 [Succinivibrio sp.]|nr:hypothetical protein [Succinivibrio sp.]
MSLLTVVLIAAPLLFVVGIIYNALKEQRRLEKGMLKKVLDERKAEEEAYRARTGKELVRRDPYEDEE